MELHTPTHAWQSESNPLHAKHGLDWGGFCQENGVGFLDWIMDSGLKKKIYTVVILVHMWTNIIN